MGQRRTPGYTEVFDDWVRRDGTPTARWAQWAEKQAPPVVFPTSLKQLSRGPGSRWRVVWVDNDGRQKVTRFTRRSDATRYEKQLTTSMSTGAYVDPQRSRTTIGALYDAWEPTTVHLKESTRVTRKNRWGKHVRPYWADREAGAIRKADVQAWIAYMADHGAKPTTIDQALTILRLVLEYAVDSGVLAANPAHGVKKPRIVNRRHAYLTVSQVELLAGECGDGGTLVRLLAYTGLRLGEAVALRVEDVDLERRRLHVHRSDTTPGGKLVEGTPKTHQARDVPLVRALVGPLAELMEGRTGGDRVFVTLSGTPVRGDNFRHRVYSEAVKRAMAADSSMPRVTIHDLRHTAASLAVKAGGNVKAVQRMLGHASAAMTLDRYSDLFDDDLDNLVGRLDDLVGGATNVLPTDE